MSEVIDSEIEDFLAGAEDSPIDDSADEMEGIEDEFRAAGAAEKKPTQATGVKVVESRRQLERRHINWRVALIQDDGVIPKVFYGKGYDLTMEGMSIRSDSNLSFSGEVRLLLEVPSSSSSAYSFIEARSKVIYSVLSGGCFQIGLKFNEFAGTGRSLLAAQFN